MGHGLSQQQNKIMEALNASPQWVSIADLLALFNPPFDFASLWAHNDTALSSEQLSQRLKQFSIFRRHFDSATGKGRDYWNMGKNNLPDLRQAFDAYEAHTKRKPAVKASVSRSITGLVKLGLIERVHCTTTVKATGMQLGRRTYGVRLVADFIPSPRQRYRVMDFGASGRYAVPT